MFLQLIKEEDIAEVLEIYAPYVQNTAITFEYDVPSKEEFKQRMRKTRSEEQRLNSSHT